MRSVTRARLSRPRSPRLPVAATSFFAAPYVLRETVHHGFAANRTTISSVFAGQSGEQPMTPSWPTAARQRRRATGDNGAVTDRLQRSFYDEVGGAETFRSDRVAVLPAGPRGRDPATAVPRRTISTAPRNGCGCSSSSTGAARAPTPTSAAIPGCGCVMRRSGSASIERDAWLRCMHTAVAEIDAQTLDDAAPPSVARLSGDGRAVHGQLPVLTPGHRPNDWPRGDGRFANCARRPLLATTCCGTMAQRDRTPTLVVERRLLSGLSALVPRQQRRRRR